MFPRTCSKTKIKVELHLPDCAKRSDLKNATGINTSKSASLKSDIDRLNLDKLEKVPSGLSSLKSKIVTLHVDKLAPIPVDFYKNK